MIRRGSRKGGGFRIVEIGPVVVTDTGASKVGDECIGSI